QSPAMTEPQTTLSNWRKHPFNVWGFSHVDQLVATGRISAGNMPTPLPEGEPLDLAAIRTAAGASIGSALDESFTDGFIVLHDGAIVAERYAAALDARTPHIIFSVSKSLTGGLAGILVDRGEPDVDKPVTHY